MFTSKKSMKGLAAAIILGAFAAGCEGGVDLDVNAPILNAAGVNVKEALMGKPAPEPNLPDRGPLVLPPQHASLPVPGQPAQSAALNNAQWPTDPEEAKKQAAKDAAAKQDDYCKNGEWTGEKRNIDQFNKNTGQDTRCRPSWISRILHPEDEKKTQ
jgi:hypothetical protein